MTAQEVFDIVATHLLTQNQKALGPPDNPAQDRREQVCKYRTRGPDGEVLKCAIGCLIPDNLYSPILEGSGIYFVLGSMEDMFGEKGATFSKQMDSHRELLTLLQRVHDTKEVAEWPRQLRTLACEFSLDYTVVDEFK